MTSDLIEINEYESLKVNQKEIKIKISNHFIKTLNKEI